MTDSDIQPSEPDTPALATTEYPFTFSGNGGEYFRIWIVNIALSVITFGIYSAWATVRTRRYFYGNTTLDGTPFQFTARALPILIGRIIAVAVFSIYGVLLQLNPLYGIGFALFVITPLAPWVIMKSLQFKARYTAWRNLSFRFTGGYWYAAFTFLLMPLAVGLTLGLLTPEYWKNSAKYQFGNISYGSLSTRFSKTAKGFWSTFGLVVLFGFLSLLLIGLVGMLGATAVKSLFGEAAGKLEGGGGIVLLVFIQGLFLLLYLPIFFLSFWVQGRLFNVALSNTFFGTPLRPIALKPTMPTTGFAWVKLSNVFLLIVTLGLFWPWAKVREFRYKMQHLAIATSKPLAAEAAAAEEGVSATGSEMTDIFDFDISLF